MTDDSPRRFGVPLITLYLAAGFSVLYAYIVFYKVGVMQPSHFGIHVYDELYLALMNGRLDLPPRVIRFEGFYSKDGQAFMYQGMAPLLTRFAAGPFVDLTKVSLAGVSILFWAVLGTVFFHLALIRAAFVHYAPYEGNGTIAYLLLTVALWLGGPGLFLVSNISHYHEPIALSYAAAGIFIFCWAGAIENRWHLRRVLLPLALAAVLSIHSRPEVGVGLTLGVVVAVICALRTDRLVAAPSALAAFAVLALGGFGYLALNELRFGTGLGAMGASAEPLVYGNRFWSYEAEDSPRFTAFREHGTFNLLRVLPNILFYTFSPSQEIFPGAYKAGENLYRSVTMPFLGFIRVERFVGGALFLWMTWVLLAARAIRVPWGVLRAYAGLLLATGVAAILLLSYGTVTSRYIVSIWPVIASLALVGLWVPIHDASDRSARRRAVLILAVATVLSALLNWMATREYRTHFTEQQSPYFQQWTLLYCQELSAIKGFDAATTADVCRTPKTAGKDLE